MRYRELCPPAALAMHVECLWLLDPQGRGGSKRILPDNCMDIYVAGAQSPWVAGPATMAHQLGAASAAPVVGLRLRPGAGAALLRLSADALRNQHAPLIDIARIAHPGLGERIADAMSDGERMALLSNAFAPICARSAPPDPVVAAALRRLTADRSAGALARTCGALGIGERQLRRRFLQSIGYGPKRFLRIARFQQLLDLARMRRAQRDWAALALDAGYADQAHMINDVQEIAGVSPTRLDI